MLQIRSKMAQNKIMKEIRHLISAVEEKAASAETNDSKSSQEDVGDIGALPPGKQYHYFG